MVIVFYCCIIIFIQHMIVNQLTDCFQSKIRVNSTCAIAEQCCKMMHFSWFPGFQNNGKRCTLLCLYQMLMYRGYCK